MAKEPTTAKSLSSKLFCTSAMDAFGTSSRYLGKLSWYVNKTEYPQEILLFVCVNAFLIEETLFHQIVSFVNY